MMLYDLNWMVDMVLFDSLRVYYIRQSALCGAHREFITQNINKQLIHSIDFILSQAESKLWTIYRHRDCWTKNFQIKMILNKNKRTTNFSANILKTLRICNFFDSIVKSVPKYTSIMLEWTNRTEQAAVFRRHCDASRLDRFDHACVLIICAITE